MNTPTRNRGFLLSLCLVAVVGTGCTEFGSDTAEIFGSAPKTTVATERIGQPPPTKALVNFHYPLNSYDSTMGSLLGADINDEAVPVGNIEIFDGNGQLLIYLPEDCVFQHVCDPGEQLFLAWFSLGATDANNAAVVKADLLPGETYDILVGIKNGWSKNTASIIPLTKDEPQRAKLAKFEGRERWAVALNPHSPRVNKFEAHMTGQIEKIQTDLMNGKTNRVLYLHPDDHR